jgi:hypothetical protein
MSNKTKIERKCVSSLSDDELKSRIGEGQNQKSKTGMRDDDGEGRLFESMFESMG